MPAYVRTIRKDTLPDGASRAVRIDNREIGRFNVDGRVYAPNDPCPHQYHPLSKGPLCGAVVRCALHGWQFDVTTGRPPGEQLFPRVSTYDVVERDGWILVDPTPRRPTAPATGEP